jgi:hypothetical protein
MGRSTTVPATRLSHPQGAARPGRRVAVALAAIGGLFWIASAAWLVIELQMTGGSDSTPAPTTPLASAAAAVAPEATTRAIGETQSLTIAGGAAPATMTLDVTAEVPSVAEVDGRQGVSEVPAGLPVTLSFRVPETFAGKVPTLSASAQERSTPGGAPVERAAHDVSLDRTEVFLLNRQDGSLVLPAYGESRSRPDGAPPDAHDHGSALTRGMPGGGLAWATTISGGVGEIAMDPAGRWLAIAQPDLGRVQLVDLAAREMHSTVAVGTAPDRVWFSPSGTLWVAGTSDRGLTMVDPATAKARPVGGVDVAVRDLAVAGQAGLAVAVGVAGTDVLLVDSATARVVQRLTLGAEPVAVAWAEHVFDSGAFVVAHRTGVLTVLALEDRTISVAGNVAIGGSGADIATVEVSPDGRTAVAPDRESASVAVVDLERRHLLRIVEAATEPTAVVFLEHFAVVRNAGSPDVTWIDLTDPRKSDNLTVGSVAPADLAVTADGAELLAPIAADGRVFRIHVMMGRPMVMGSDDDPTGADLALPVRAALYEEQPGVFVHRAVFDRAGTYRLRLSWPSGAHADGFVIDVAAPPSPEQIARPVAAQMTTDVGTPVVTEFTADRSLAAAEVLAYADTAAGPRQVRVAADPVGDGGWRAELSLPAPGTYRAYLVATAAGLTTETGLPVVIVVSDG